MTDTTPATPATDKADSPEINAYALAISSKPVDGPAIVAAYAACDTGDKTRARSMLQGRIVALGKAMSTPDDMAEVQALIAAQEAQAVAKASAPVEVNWNDRAATRVATLRLAADMIEFGVIRPTSVPEEFALDLAKVTEGAKYVTELWNHLGDDDPFVKVVHSLAHAPIGGTRAAAGDVAAHITEALTDMPEGTVATVAMLRNAETSEYPEGAPRPSSGGISARLIKNSVEGDLAGVITVQVEGQPLSARLA